MLLGAVLTADLPIMLNGVYRMTGSRGWQFELAVEVLQVLAAEREQPRKGLTSRQLRMRLRVESQQLAPVLQALAELDWVGAVQPPEAAAAIDAPAPRYVLLVDPASTPLQPLIAHLLLAPSSTLQPLWQRAQLEHMHLQDLL